MSETQSAKHLAALRVSELDKALSAAEDKRDAAIKQAKEIYKLEAAEIRYELTRCQRIANGK